MTVPQPFQSQGRQRARMYSGFDFAGGGF